MSTLLWLSIELCFSSCRGAFIKGCHVTFLSLINDYKGDKNASADRLSSKEKHASAIMPSENGTRFLKRLT